MIDVTDTGRPAHGQEGEQASMDPVELGPEQWAQDARALHYLIAFTGLALTGALAFLLAHAVLPSLITASDQMYFSFGSK